MSALLADYSYISSFAECARKGYYRYERGIEPREGSVPMHAGSALHEGLHVLYRDNWDVDAAVAAMYDYWGDFRTPAVSKWSYLTAGHCEIILHNYAEDRRTDRVQLLKLKPSELQLEKLAVDVPPLDDQGFVRLAESPLAIRWGDDLIYAGKIDMPARVGSLLYVVDFKCTSQWLTEYWAAGYAFSHQMRGYVAIMSELTGVPLAGCYINGVYMGKEAADDKAKWSKRSSSRNQLFGPYVYAPAHLEETRQWARSWLRQVARWREDDYFPQNDRSCKGCEFAPLCKANPIIRESIIKQDYRLKVINGILASGADSHDRRAEDPAA